MPKASNGGKYGLQLRDGQLGDRRRMLAHETVQGGDSTYDDHGRLGRPTVDHLGDAAADELRADPEPAGKISNCGGTGVRFHTAEKNENVLFKI